MSRCLLGCLATAGLLAATACASTEPKRVATPAPFPRAPIAPDRAQPESPRSTAIIDAALALLGTPYRAGGRTPATGFDCSGFTQYVFDQQHVALPRTVAEQRQAGRKVSRDEARAGDLVFFRIAGSEVSHVGLVIDEGRFAHAPDSGAAVRLERLDAPYWQRRYAETRRVF